VTTLRYAAGECLVAPKGSTEHVFVVREGHAHISRFTRDGKRAIVNFLFPGDFFGFTSADRYAFGVYAIDDAVVCRLARTDFEQLVATVPTAEHSLRERLTRALDGIYELIFSLGRKTALEKVASLILYLGYRQRGLGPETGQVHVPMSRADIADFLGLTSESVSRCMTELKRSGVVRLPRPDLVEVASVPALLGLGVIELEP